MNMTAPIDLGPLAAALAKAQAAFPAIPRDREVTVQLKTGGSYKFKYAPLDTILTAVRPALAANGLAISQHLDGSDLVTMLLHSDGATLSGRVAIPQDGNIQQLGSAITYLRRYALQAMLGIASEDDDDGNASAGNKATPVRRERFLSDRETATAEPTTAFDAGLVGTAEVGKGAADFELRQTPTGHVLIFRLVEGRTGMKVVATNGLAEQIAEYRAGIEGKRVTCWGAISEESFPKAGKTITYSVLNLSRIKVGVLDLAEPDHEPSEDEDALIEELGDAMDAPVPVPAA